MEITNELIDKLSGLARLEFDGEEKDRIRQDLQKIVGFVDKLSELDTEKVEPLIFMSDSVNVLREDEVKQEISREDALRNAPKKDSDYFRVPKFLDK
jgi:aspartyl-tRNA(Asn)/glutamyl-tRNA(Gln) amidotransferase subunit C